MVTRRLVLLALALFSANPFVAVEAASYRIADLNRLIENGGHNSLDGLLGALPREMRSLYALVYASRSPNQRGSFAHPRMLLADIGEEKMGSSLWLAVSGDPSDPAYNVLEAIAFNEENANYDFYRMEFDPTGATAPKVFVNPTGKHSCVPCHRGRPIWEGFAVRPAWVGIYGGVAADEVAAPALFAREMERFSEHFQGRLPTGRYALLEGFAGATPYGGGSGVSLRSLNFRFEEKLTWSLAQYSAAQMRGAENFLVARSAILATLLNLDSAFISTQLSHLRNDQATAAVVAMVAQHNTRKARRYAEGLGLSSEAPIPTLRTEVDLSRAASWDLIFRTIGHNHGGDLLSASMREWAFDWPLNLEANLTALILNGAMMDHLKLLDLIFDLGGGDTDLRLFSSENLKKFLQRMAELDHALHCQRKILGK